jgi:pimeloyl-ACP methyl ester carboxylesterase
MPALQWKLPAAVITAAALTVVIGCAGLPSTVRHAEVNGARLAYVEQGEGPTVVLVHGSVADHRTWDRQRATLARQHYRVIAYSQRYFGTEPWSPGWPKIGVPVQSDDLAAFIRGLHAGPVHLVGWSSGGVVALNVALQHPELVKSAFVYEPPIASVVTDEADRKTIADDRSAAFTPAVKAVRAGDNVAALRLVLDAVDDRSNVLDGWPPAEQAVAIANARTLPLEFFDSDSTPALACAQLGQLKPVVVVARGGSTRSSYRLMADAAAQCIGGSRHVVVPNARHLWPADEPQAFSEAVLRFLRLQP